MKDPIIEHIENHRDSLDIEVPGDHLWEGIEAELRPEGKKNRAIIWWTVAAGVAIAIAIGSNEMLNSGDDESVAEAAPPVQEEVQKDGMTQKELAEKARLRREQKDQELDQQAGLTGIDVNRNAEGNAHRGLEGQPHPFGNDPVGRDFDLGRFNKMGQNNAIQGHDEGFFRWEDRSTGATATTGTTYNWSTTNGSGTVSNLSGVNYNIVSGDQLNNLANVTSNELFYSDSYLPPAPPPPPKATLAPATWSQPLIDGKLGLDANGTYTVTVTDANRATATNQPITVTGASATGTNGFVTLNNISPNSTTCSGTTNGQVTTLTATGGTQPYNYQWTAGDPGQKVEEIKVDPVNTKDEQGRKQGKWVVYGKDRPELTGYGPNDIVEEGTYKDGRKHGDWKSYNPGNNIKTEIEYKYNRPNGKFRKYHSTYGGQPVVAEEGEWKGNKYVGEYRKYHPNGQVAQQKTYNDAGKTAGAVTYYYPNGQQEFAFEGRGGDGQPATRYYPNGDVKEVVHFDAQGQIASVAPKQRVNPTMSVTENVKSAPHTDAAISHKSGLLHDGFNKLYNDNKDLMMDGQFKNGKLYNGKWYKYNKDGLLEKIEIYKNGKYFGDGVLDFDGSSSTQTKTTIPPTPKVDPHPQAYDPYADVARYYEQYDDIVENKFIKTIKETTSTFSIDVDGASYSNCRRFINSNKLPPKNAVRLEELMNYFDYDLKAPGKDAEHPFNITSEMGECPWDDEHKILQVTVKGKEINKEEIPASNLVFLIDVSGSMSSENKIGLLKKGFTMLTNELRAEDRVTIVVYAGAAGEVLAPTPGNDQAKILNAINNLRAGGSTAGGAGIELAYKRAKENFIKGGNNRVILATDGDFNVGISDDDALVKLIEEKRKSGIFLSVLGFGTGNLQDSKMEKIANNGNGNYSYIDNVMEAKKVMVSEFGGTMFTIAKDVKIQLYFNPSQVESYRLIGYENRMLKNEDFANDKKDAGELGVGHSLVALYEIVPNKTGKISASTGELSQEMIELSKSTDWLRVKFRYKPPNKDKSILIKHDVDYETLSSTNSNTFNWAVAVAQYGLLLRDSEYQGTSNFADILKRARAAMGSDGKGYRAEFIKLVEHTQVLMDAYHRQLEAKK